MREARLMGRVWFTQSPFSLHEVIVCVSIYDMGETPWETGGTDRKQLSRACTEGRGVGGLAPIA